MTDNPAPLALVEKRHCAGTNKRGTPCLMQPVGDDGYCDIHTPDKERMENSPMVKNRIHDPARAKELAMKSKEMVAQRRLAASMSLTEMVAFFLRKKAPDIYQLLTEEANDPHLEPEKRLQIVKFLTERVVGKPREFIELSQGENLLTPTGKFAKPLDECSPAELAEMERELEAQMMTETVEGEYTEVEEAVVEGALGSELAAELDLEPPVPITVEDEPVVEEPAASVSLEDISSSQIAAATWEEDPAADGIGTLTVDFTSGHRYSYTGVPLSLMDEWQEAPSKGSWFAENIRKSFPYERLDKPL